MESNQHKDPSMSYLASVLSQSVSIDKEQPLSFTITHLDATVLVEKVRKA